MATPFPFHITTSEGLLLPIPSGGVIGHPRSVKATFAGITMLDDECRATCDGGSAVRFRVRCNEVNQALYVRAQAPTCYLWQATNFAEVIIWSSDEECCDINQQQCAETQVEVKFDSERDKVVVWAATRGDSAADGVQDVCSPYSRFYWFYGELDYCDWAAAWPGPYVIPNQLTVTHTTQGSGTTNCFVRPDTGETVIAIGYGGQVTLDEFSACEMPDQLPGQQCAVGPDWVCDPEADNVCYATWTAVYDCATDSVSVELTSSGCIDPSLITGDLDTWVSTSEGADQCTWTYTTVFGEGVCANAGDCTEIPAAPSPPNTDTCPCCEDGLPEWWLYSTACFDDCSPDQAPPSYPNANVCAAQAPGPLEWTAVGCVEGMTQWHKWTRGIKSPNTNGECLPQGCCGGSLPIHITGCAGSPFDDAPC